MKQGTARSLLSDRLIENYTSNGCTVEFEVKSDLQEVQHLSNLVSLNCLVGPTDFLPGLLNSYLPQDFALFKAEKDLSSRKDIYAHNIKLSNMKRVEEIFG